MGNAGQALTSASRLLACAGRQGERECRMPFVAKPRYFPGLFSLSYQQLPVAIHH